MKVRQSWLAVRSLILMIGVVANGCTSNIPFETIDQGFYSGYQDRTALVVRTEEAWQQLWDRHSALIVPKPKPPVVDFDKEMLIAVFLGERPTGGFAIEITHIEQEANALHVLVEETSPPPDAMVTQAFTSPYHLIRLNRTNPPVEFEFRTNP